MPNFLGTTIFQFPLQRDFRLHDFGQAAIFAINVSTKYISIYCERDVITANENNGVRNTYLLRVNTSPILGMYGIIW